MESTEGRSSKSVWHGVFETTWMHFKHLSIISKGLVLISSASFPLLSEHSLAILHYLFFPNMLCSPSPLSLQTYREFFWCHYPQLPLCLPAPLLSMLLGCHLAHLLCEYQPRCHLFYKAFSELPKSEVNTLPEYTLKVLPCDPSTLCGSHLITCLFHVSFLTLINAPHT